MQVVYFSLKSRNEGIVHSFVHQERLMRQNARGIGILDNVRAPVVTETLGPR